MKNKLKKIIPLILCFVLVAGSCLTVNAAKISSDKLSSGSSGEYYASAIRNVDNSIMGLKLKYLINSSNDEVRSFAVCGDLDSSFSYISIFFVSKKTFNISHSSNGAFINDIDCSELVTSDEFNGPSNAIVLNYNGTTYYYRNFNFMCGENNGKSLSLGVSNLPYVHFNSECVGFFNGNDAFGKIIEKAYLADFIWDDGFALEYAQQPSAEIEPPKNLSIYRGYSNADKQYKFQMQWDKPADIDLNVEVMYNIHWKEGTGSALGFGTHVYKKYQHLVYDDGHSAQTNKLQYLEDDLLKEYFESQEMDVPSVYNIDEIYVRFAKEVDGVIQYSLWRKIDYLNLDEGNGFDSTEDDFQAESSTGAFDTSDNWIDQSVQNGEIVNGSDKEDAKAPGLDANGDNITNVTKPIVNPDSWDSEFSNVFDSFTNAIKSAFSFVGEFPSMLSEFFGFLPASVIGCISIGLIMVVVLRFLGR